MFTAASMYTVLAKQGGSSGGQNHRVALAGTTSRGRGLLWRGLLHRCRLIASTGSSSCTLGSLHCCYCQILQGRPSCLLLARSRPNRGRFHLLCGLLPRYLRRLRRLCWHRWLRRLRCISICVFQQGTEATGLDIQSPLGCGGGVCC